jgi:hypothetical protein
MRLPGGIEAAWRLPAGLGWVSYVFKSRLKVVAGLAN